MGWSELLHPKHKHWHTRWIQLKCPQTKGKNSNSSWLGKARLLSFLLDYTKPNQTITKDVNLIEVPPFSQVLINHTPQHLFSFLIYIHYYSIHWNTPFSSTSLNKHWHIHSHSPVSFFLFNLFVSLELSLTDCAVPVMALCAFSFPVHLNRATISGPRRSTPPSSSHYQWGAYLLSHSHHRLDQVTSFSFSFIHQLTWTQSYCVGEGIPMMAMGEKNIALKVWTLISFALACSSFHSHWKISFVWLALSSFVFPNFIVFFVICKLIKIEMGHAVLFWMDVGEEKATWGLCITIWDGGVSFAETTNPLIGYH